MVMKPLLGMYKARCKPLFGACSGRGAERLHGEICWKMVEGRLPFRQEKVLEIGALLVLLKGPCSGRGAALATSRLGAEAARSLESRQVVTARRVLRSGGTTSTGVGSMAASTSGEGQPSEGRRTAPIFVVGHPRSGTTLLRLILNAHSRIVIPPEAHIASFLRRCESKYGPLVNEASRRQIAERLVSKRRMKEWELDSEEMYMRIMEADPPTPAGVFEALMSLWTDKARKPRWGEKTPGTYRFLPEVNQWFPDSQVIHIVRDGRDVAVSCLNPPFADFYDKGNVYEVAVRWRHALACCRRAKRTLGPERFLQIRYEDLVADPEKVTRSICDFLGERFEPAMLDYHESAKTHVARGDSSFHERTKKSVNRGRVERWRNDAAPDFIAGFEGIASRDLEALGYSLSGITPQTRQQIRILYERLKPRRLIKNYRPPGGQSAEKRSSSSADG